MARRVLLHVGTPKTATTYLQDVLFRNRDLLQRHGVHYPCDTFDAQFRAALDLLRREWGGLEDQVVGEWDALAARVRAVEDGTVIVSNEILGGATREQARRAVESLGGPDATVELVITARDLMRQVPAEWQETVKHFSTETYDEFLAAIRSREGRTADLFWAVQDLPAIIDRWGVPTVHLVTVPTRRSEMWPRLEQAFGLAGIPLDRDTDRTNTGLGMPEASLVRDLNERTDMLTKDEYRWLVMELLAHRTLARRTSPKIGVPLDAVPWLQELSRDWVSRLSGVHVIGDLDDLLGTPTPYTEPTAQQKLDAAEDAIVVLLEECARLGELSAHDRQPSAREALRVLYRRARGRSSRPA